MPVELLIARPATGKTQNCIEKVQKTLSSSPLSTIWVIVPDRLQAGAFRRRLAEAGGAMGAQVGTFGDLYRGILEQTGNSIPIASAPLLHFIIQEVVDNSFKSGKLIHYGSLRTMPGFFLALRDSFAELKRSLIFPEQFIRFAQGGTPAQQELAELYFSYQTRLRDLHWADAEGLSWLAVEALENHSSVARSICLLVVDGFDSFTGAQRRTLELLANQVGELFITFPGEVNSPRLAHRRFGDTLEKLAQSLSPTLATLAQAPFLPTEALQLEKLLFEPGETSIKEAREPFLIEARSPADEAREALRWIKSCIVRQELALSDCAIFTPNPAVYNPFLRATAQEFGIPVHFSQGTSLTTSPAITALLNMLALTVQNFKSRMLFNTLRSPYFKFGLDSAGTDMLEEISRQAKIIGGRQQWQETWEMLAPTQSEQIEFDDERRLPGLPRGEQAQALRESLEFCFNIISPSVEPLSQTGWVSWLEDLLERLGFYEQSNHERDAIACELLRETLRALVLSETVIGERVLSYADFISTLQSALNGVAFPEPRLKAQPTVLIGQMAEARGLRFRAVALLGLSEGVFPLVERSDPFLNEAIREKVGLESRLNREQAGLFYQAVARTDDYLLITRPYMTDSGEDWEPSPFWKDVLRCFGKAAVTRIRPDDALSLNEAASIQELLFLAVRHKKLPRQFQELTPRWEKLRYARNILKARRAKQASGVHEGSALPLSKELTERYAPSKIWSASRLEAYGRCPHQFYVREALGLEPRTPPEPGWSVVQMGFMFHKILEEAYRKAANPADVASVMSILPEIASEVFEDAPRQYGFRPSSLWEFEKAEFISILQNTIQELHEQSEGWTPLAFEVKFGINDDPPLEIDIGGETIQLRGVIDRLDCNEAGEIRVVDYKSGGSHLDPKDLKSGARLQLPIYALAAMNTLELGRVTEGFYWNIRGAAPGALKLSKFRTDNGYGVNEAIRIVIEHLHNILNGIRAAEFPPNPPKEGCSAYCPAVQWCWHYEPGWVGGK
jgi:ATP-dependent helicase/DNAse subunit B